MTMNHHPSCQVCHKACRPLRCTSCRQAWYCSQKCQKKDWTAGHRNTCRKSRSAATTQPRPIGDDDDDDERRSNHAMMELASLVANTNKLSLEELSAEFYRAKDEVERLQQSTTKTKPRSTISGAAKETYSKGHDTKTTTIERTVPGNKSNADRTKSLLRKAASVASSPQKIESMGNCDSSQQEPTTYWDFWIENLTHISCYHIVLQPTNHSNHQHSQYWLLKQPISELARQLEFRVTVSADRQSSIVSLRHKSDDDNNNTYTILFNARLPGQVQSMPSAFQIQQSESQKSVEHGLNLRLQYDAPIHNILEQDASLLAAGLTKTDANRLGCRQCHLPLLAGDGKEGAAVIDRVVRMPSANWDDIADYLICYNGQATIDFSTSSTNNAQAGVALVDTSAIVLHQDDVGSSVGVLAVEGYGEHSTIADAANTTEPLSEEPLSSSTLTPPLRSPFAAAAAELGNDAPAVIRGPRSWRETVGGGSICCSQCCSVLGFASLTSPGTYRFLKHRLALLLNTPATSNNQSGQQPNNDLETRNATPLISADSFVAHEMIRYAETKAIFTFMVERKDDAGLSFQRRVLLLKLLSWDSQVATSSDVSYVSSDGHLVQEVNLRKAAKMIFEETWLDSRQKGAKDTRNNDDISSWVWGGADLCCQPNFVGSVGATVASNEEQGNDKINQGALGQKASTSSVWLLLEKDEWDELLKSLCKGAQLFSREVVEATVAAKLGRRVIPNSPANGLGLSLVPVAL